MDRSQRFAFTRYLIRHTRPHASLADRAKGIVHVLRHARHDVAVVADLRCRAGAEVVAELGLGGEVTEAIRALDERYDGGGVPDGLVGEQIPLLTRVVQSAQTAEVWASIGGPRAARSQLRRRTGSMLDPQLVTAFDDVSRTGPCGARWTERRGGPSWTRCATTAGRCWTAAASSRSRACSRASSIARAVHGAAFRARGADRGCDRGAARRARAAAPSAALRGGAAARHRQARGLQHGPGRPRKLTSSEWAEMRRHVALTYEILRPVGSSPGSPRPPPRTTSASTGPATTSACTTSSCRAKCASWPSPIATRRSPRCGPTASRPPPRARSPSSPPDAHALRPRGRRRIARVGRRRRSSHARPGRRSRLTGAATRLADTCRFAFEQGFDRSLLSRILSTLTAAGESRRQKVARAHGGARVHRWNEGGNRAVHRALCWGRARGRGMSGGVVVGCCGRARRAGAEHRRPRGSHNRCPPARVEGRGRRDRVSGRHQRGRRRHPGLGVHGRGDGQQRDGESHRRRRLHERCAGAGPARPEGDAGPLPHHRAEPRRSQRGRARLRDGPE